MYKSHDTCSKSAINKSFSSSFGCDPVILLCVATELIFLFFKSHATHVIKVFVSLIALAEVPRAPDLLYGFTV